MGALAVIPTTARPIVFLIERPGDDSMFKVAFTTSNCGGPANLSSEDILQADTLEFPNGSWVSLHRCQGALHSYAGNMPFDAFKAQLMAGKLVTKRGAVVTQLPPFQENGRYKVASWAESDSTMMRLVSAASPGSPSAGSANGGAAQSRTADMAIAPGGPSANDIARAHARIYARYYGSRTTPNAGEEIYSSPMGDVYRVHRSVSNGTCTKVRPAAYQCSYTLRRQQEANEGGWAGLSGKILVAFGGIAGTSDTNTRFTYAFTRAGTGWTAPKLDLEIADAARKAREQAAAPKTNDGCGSYRDYSDLSSVEPRYSYQCHPGSRPDR